MQLKEKLSNLVHGPLLGLGDKGFRITKVVGTSGFDLGKDKGIALLVSRNDVYLTTSMVEVAVENGEVDPVIRDVRVNVILSAPTGLVQLGKVTMALTSTENTSFM